MRRSLIVLLLSLFSLPALAASLDVMVEIPRLHVAEYHRPYVAVWIENGQHDVAAQLAVWYQLHGREDGRKWLKDLRQWWRRGGRSLNMPVDGITGATRPVGQHRLHFTFGKPPLGKLAPGDYTLIIEAVRETGGREYLRFPFSWPVKDSLHLEKQGQRELGKATLDITF